MKSFATIFLSSLVLSSCASLKRSAVSFPNGPDGASYGRLFVWDADVSAGVGSSDGVCVQSAVTDNGVSGSAAIKALEKAEVGGAVSTDRNQHLQ